MTKRFEAIQVAEMESFLNNHEIVMATYKKLVLRMIVGVSTYQVVDSGNVEFETKDLEEAVTFFNNY